MDQSPEHQQDTAPTIIVDHHKEMSSRKKSFLIVGALVLAVLVGISGFAIYQNGQIDAASCVTNVYKSGSQDKCIGYIQKMVNGVTEHYGIIPKNNVTLPSGALTANSKLDQKTIDKVAKLRQYTASTTTGTDFVKKDWVMVCMWARQSYRAYTTDLRPSSVQTARDGYKSAGCASLVTIPPISDDPTVPGPVAGASVSDATTVDTPQVVDQVVETQAVGTTSSSPATTASSSSNVPHLTIASWNIEGGNPDNNKTSSARTAFTKDRSAGLTALSGSSDIIALQESHLHGFRNAITTNFTCAAATCKLAGLDLTNAYPKQDASKDDGSLPASVPILWNKNRFQLEDYGYYTALGSGYTDAAGGWVSLKWITWVQLKDVSTGKAFFVLNTHTVAGVESKGMPKYDLSKSYAKLSKSEKAAYQRLDTFNAHMDLLISLVQYLKEQSLPIFVAGDFNVNYRYDSTLATPYKDFPYVRLGAVALKSNYQLAGLGKIANTVGTEGGGSRLIDYVFSWDKGNVDYLSTGVGANRYGSDHTPMSFTIGLE